MRPIGIIRPSSRSFISTIVKLSVRPSSILEENELPGIVEIQAYLHSLNTIVLAYHHKREKRIARFDHLYLVFQTSRNADDFRRMWGFWDDSHFMKGNYELQHDSDFPSVVLHLLQDEIEYISKVIGPVGTEKPTRFVGFAFDRIGPIGAKGLLSSASLEEKCNFLEETLASQEVGLSHLEEMVNEVREDLDKKLKENMELRAQLACYQEKWKQINNVDIQASGRKYRE
ncbi:unnamed protein product [Rhizoctonia solani]|uniref:Uncharacterized protein n=1 Tax=Rhizoctonia solani TaxID=456999 RepID=A0A8H3DR68_9AGAM|nr:unnamed protein product [Rhizoctonia solani]